MTGSRKFWPKKALIRPCGSKSKRVTSRGVSLKNAISKIDRALKRLYNLHSPLQAEDFLLRRPYSSSVDQAPPGALYIEPPTPEEDTLSLGIYLNPSVQTALDDFPQWARHWNAQQLAAFGLAAEEVSHFHYVAHHAPQGRGVSQLELELQGEVDKFLITFFARPVAEEPFTALLERFFENFHFHPKLDAEQRERYAHAHTMAKAFLVKHADLFRGAPQDKLLKIVREFYRLSLEEKVSLATR
jgi:hypothetical protein